MDYFLPCLGQGNASVFDATAGTGGWVGSIGEVPGPANPGTPLSLVSLELFTLDRAAHTLTGTFEFTTTDLLSTLHGEGTGTFLDSDILTQGGQFSIEYRTDDGSGQFARPAASAWPVWTTTRQSACQPPVCQKPVCQKPLLQSQTCE